MMQRVNKAVKYLSLNPKTLFLIDSTGALITTFSLFVVLRNFNEHFGMPKATLTYLSVFAACLCIYSTVCFLKLKDKHAPFIMGISMANLLYCIVTISLMIYYTPLLTLLGITYFVAEVIIVCALAYIEVRVASLLREEF